MTKPRKRLQVTDSPLQFIVRGKAGKVWIYFVIRHGVARLSVSYASQQDAEEDRGVVSVWKSPYRHDTVPEAMKVLVDLASYLSEEIRSNIHEYLPSEV